MSEYRSCTGYIMRWCLSLLYHSIGNKLSLDASLVSRLRRIAGQWNFKASQEQEQKQEQEPE